jgi:hypothetical protein
MPDTPPPTQPHPFALGSAVLALSAAAALAFALAVVFTGIAVGDRVEMAALIRPAVVGWLSSLAALGPVAMLAHGGPHGVLRGYLIGAGTRVLICLLAAVLFIKLSEPTRTAVILTLVGTYLVTLFVESALVARHLWSTPRTLSPTPPQMLPEASA